MSRKQIDQEIEAYTGGKIEGGVRMAQPSAREQTTLRLPGELMDALRRQARERGYTVHDLMMLILWEHFDGSTLPE